MKFKDYYEILGVPRTATADEIKKSFKKLAHLYHPDVSKDPKGEEKFKEINEAYATLKDQEKRAAYDELGRHPTGQEFKPPPSWSSNPEYSFNEADLADFFANFSSNKHDRSQRHQQSNPGQDYELSTQISLEEAYHGTTTELHFVVPEYDAQGRLQQVPHTLKTRIPKGVTHQTKMLLRGKGGKGFHGGQNGNLYLNINLKPHRLFKAMDHDLYIDLPLAPWEAALGATVKVPTMESEVNLKIPAGTKSGQKLRIAKHGMPKQNQTHGDLFAVAQITVPAQLSDRELELFKALAEESTFNPRAHFAKESAHD
jgi:curved DNA-binding protein